jgi:hypothetical protein
MKMGHRATFVATVVVSTLASGAALLRLAGWSFYRSLPHDFFTASRHPAQIEPRR